MWTFERWVRGSVSPTFRRVETRYGTEAQVCAWAQTPARNERFVVVSPAGEATVTEHQEPTPPLPPLLETYKENE